jgi:hypothetical protein
MRVLVSKNDYVDLGDPIDVTEEQKEKFVVVLKSIFRDNFKVISVIEKEKNVGERESHQKRWIAEDLKLLLGSETNDELAAKMDRSTMSVSMQRGHFVPAFMVWLKKNGYALTQDEKLIKQFLKEQEEK